MKTMMLVCTAASLLFVSERAIEAHHSAAPFFEVGTAVTIKGAVVRFDPINPHSYLYVDQEAADGRVERWAIEGPPAQVRRARGIDDEALTAGVTVEVCGYLLKDSVQAPPVAKGRVLLAELVWMAGGEPRLWSDYGNRRCRDQYGVQVAAR